MVTQDDILDVMYAEVRAEVPIADQKASILLAAIGIGAGALFGGLLAGNWKPTNLNGAAEAIWWIGATFMLMAVASAAAAVWPRTGRRAIGAEIYYWGHVARHETLDAFSTAIGARRPQRTERTEYQLWHLSRQVRRKYFFVRCALVLAGLGAADFLLTVAIP